MYCHKSTISKAPDNIKITVTEDDPLDIGLDMIIPISVTVRDSGTEITAGESYAQIAHRAAELYGDNLASDEAREYLLRELAVMLADSGYTPLREAIEDDTVTFAAESVEQLNTDCITAAACAIAESDIGRYNNLTGYEPNELSRGDSSEEIPIFAVTEGKKILSLAAVEELADGCAEISVETVEGYTRRGYAASCVCALARHLIFRGLALKYVCFGSNSASVALAQRVGFERKEVCYDAVCVRDAE